MLQILLRAGNRIVIRLLIIFLAHTDDRAHYKKKFRPDAPKVLPPEYWHGYNARLNGQPSDACPYRQEKADTWRKGYNAR